MFDLLELRLHEQLVLEVRIEDDDRRVEFMADYGRAGGTITLNALHAEGPGANVIGIEGLRLIAKEVLEFLNAEILEVHGAIRTTGAGPGRLPGRAVFRRR